MNQESSKFDEIVKSFRHQRKLQDRVDKQKVLEKQQELVELVKEGNIMMDNRRKKKNLESLENL